MITVSVIRKPVQGNVAGNVFQWSTGGVDVDDCRVEGVPPSVPQPSFNSSTGRTYGEMSHAAGRWPANLIHSGEPEVVGLFPDSKTTRIEKPCPDPEITGHRWGTMQGNRGARGYDGEGSAARFFYCAKASKVDQK